MTIGKIREAINTGCSQKRERSVGTRLALTILAKRFCLSSVTFFIGPESDHYLSLSVTHSLTHSFLVDLTGLTLGDEDTFTHGYSQGCISCGILLSGT